MSYFKHGLSETKVYWVWLSMKQRCLNPKAHAFDRYGGRGIKVSPEWASSFERFSEDMGERPPGTTLERRDVNGNYCKDNCCWATPLQQGRNTRKNIYVTYKGETKCLSEWCSILGLCYRRTQRRMRKPGMTFEQAILPSPIPSSRFGRRSRNTKEQVNA